MERDMKPSGRAVFVYYKLEPSERARLEPLMRAYLEALKSRWPELEVERMRREDEEGDAQTWMDVFRCSAGVSDGMLDDIRRQAGAFGLPGPRHYEVFIGR